jgi:two-component system response regulator PhcR
MTEPQDAPLVLYVDDERANRVVFEQSLVGQFNVRCCADGESALDVLGREVVGVLVTDMRMPKMNGGELLRIAKERHPRTIRMVITAYADVEPILRAINEGLVARYIIKPWVRAELVQVLRWATEASRFSRDSDELHRRLLETERLATLGSISSALVHDLRQPLMSLTVNIDHLGALAGAVPTLRALVAASKLPRDERERLVESLDDLGPVTADLRASVEHLDALVGNLREFGRGRASDNDVPPSADPMPVLRHAMAVCQELAIHAHASIDYRGPKQLPAVRISPTELTQVLVNLLANGAQAVGARGADDRKRRVEISARAEPGLVELTIRDDGVGMTPEVLDRVGTPFFTTRAEGTGLGLAQCQRLVGTAGGRLRIESEVGVGTTVTIVLPTAA